jgi:hypothetical protein
MEQAPGALFTDCGSSLAGSDFTDSSPLAKVKRRKGANILLEYAEQGNNLDFLLSKWSTAARFRTP